LQPSQELRDLESAILRQDETLLSNERAAHGPAPPVEPPYSPPDDSEQAVPSSRPRRRSIILAGAITVGLVAVAAAIALLLRGEAASITSPPNSVALIDPATNRVVDSVPVGIRPGPVAANAGSVWVANLDDGSLTRIDVETRRAVANVFLPATPDGIAVGDGAVWVAHGRLGTLSRVDTQFDTVVDTASLAGRAIHFPTGGVALGAGTVWVVFGDSTLARVDPTTSRQLGAGLAGVGPAAVCFAYGSVWVANSGDASVQRFSTATFEEGDVDRFTVGRTPTGIAAGEGAVWVANTGDGSVTRIDPDPGFGSGLTIPVGDGPTAVAVGAGAVWVANTDAGTVSRIDPATNEVVETIEVGYSPSGILVADDLVWVAVQAS
jgi:YVTN family beta-propeller protein